VPLIEDDYDADLDLDDAPTPPRLRTLDADVCHVGTYSKRLIPALRVGYLVAPAPVREHVAALKTASDNGTSGLLQHALAEFLARGHLRAHVAATRREYRARRDALETALRAEMPDDVTWDRPARGLFLWLRLPEDVAADALHAEGLRRGVRVIPGSLAGDSRGAAHGVRATYCREGRERLAEGARRLGAALRAVRAGVARA
jgi:DNA-binding transcriptional MocR family regulator